MKTIAAFAPRPVGGTQNTALLRKLERSPCADGPEHSGKNLILFPSLRGRVRGGGFAVTGFGPAKPNLDATMRRDFSHYLKRKRVLRKLGFGSYAAYLASDLWRRIKRLVFAAKGNQCWLCVFRSANQVHHCRYSRLDLLGKRLIGMFPLCDGCHVSIEFDENGRKRTVPEMRQAFNLAKKGRGERLENFKNSRISP